MDSARSVTTGKLKAVARRYVMHITVLIPAYNTSRYLGRCCSSVLSQRITDLDILLVEDGSTDRTWDVAQSIMLRHHNVSAIHLPKNRGVAGATKAGIEMARGPLITIVDSDDVLLPGAIRAVMPAFDRDPSLGFAWSLFRTTGGRAGWSAPLPQGLSLWEAMERGWWRAAHHKWFRKESYRKSPGMDPAIRIASDYQLVALLAWTGCKTVHVPVPTYLYTFPRPGSITATEGRARQREATRKVRERLRAIPRRA